MNYLIRTMQYVRNTGGCATKEHFIEDHEPIGVVLWNNMREAGMVEINESGKIILTPAGDNTLNMSTT